MPIIRIPQSPGVAPTPSDPTAYRGAKAAYDASEKRRARQGVADAISSGLNAAASISAEQRRIDEKEDYKRGQQELDAFEAARSVKMIQLARDLKTRMEETAFDPIKKSQRIQEIQQDLVDVGRTALGSVQSESGRAAISSWVENGSKVDAEQLQVQALSAIGTIEFNQLEQSLVDRARAPGEWADRAGRAFENQALINTPPPGASFDLTAEEKKRFIDSYVRRPLLDAITDGLSNMTQVSEIAEPVLDKKFDSVLGDLKWEARRAAEDAVVRKFSALETSARGIADILPLEDQGDQMQVVVDEAIKTKPLLDRVGDETTKQAGDMLIDRLGLEVAKSRRVEREAVALLSRSVSGTTYNPYDPISQYASSVGFSRLIASPVFATLSPAEKANEVVNYVAVSHVAPESMSSWLGNLVEQVKRNDPGAVELTDALTAGFRERGMDLGQYGMIEMIMSASASSPSTDQSTTTSSKGGSSNLPREARNLAQTLASQGDVTGAVRATAYGYDLGAIDRREREAAIMVAMPEALGDVDRVFGAGTMQNAADTETRLNFYVASRLAGSFASQRQRRNSMVEGAKYSTGQRIISLVKADEEKAIAEAMKLTEEQLGITEEMKRERGGGNILLNVKRQQVVEGIRRKSASVDSAVLVAMSGVFGDEARQLATKYSQGVYEMAEPRGWDPTNPRSFDKIWLNNMAADIIDEADSVFPDFARQGKSYQATIDTITLKKISEYHVSRFSPGHMVHAPPETIRPDAFEVWQNEFNPGGKLHHLAESKDAIVSNVVAAAQDPVTGGWSITFVDPVDGAEKQIPDYRLLLDDDNYLRMLSLDGETREVSLAVAAKQAAMAQIAEKTESRLKAAAKRKAVQDNRASVKARDLTVLDPPTKEELASIYTETNGFQFPLIGGDNVTMVLRQLDSGSEFSMAPDAVDMDLPPPPSTLIEKLESTNTRWGYPVVSRDEAMEISSYLSRLDEWSDAKADRLIRAIPEGGDPDEIEFEKRRIRSMQRRWKMNVAEAKASVVGMTEWWDMANEFGFNDQLTGQKLYEEWRKLNLYGQMQAWRRWRGMPKLDRKDAESQLQIWVQTGGYEEWLTTPVEIRQAFE